MQLDLRLPIGLLFSVFGVILVATGLMTPAAAYQQSLGINVNLWWGLVLLVFGVLMLGFGRRSRAKAP
jgi:hypothetical protein